MPRFYFKATETRGRKSQGIIEAATQNAAVDTLIARGLTPLSIRTETDISRRGLVGLKRDERLSFIRDLANLVTAGFAIEPALGLISEQMARPAAAELVGDLRRRVRSGETLAEAVAAHDNDFPPEFSGLIAAGEQGGTLANALRHLESLTEDRAAFRQRLVSALIYPALLSLMTLGALGLLAGYVIPQFEDLFAGSKAQLPASTRAVLAIGKFLGTYGFFLLLVPAAVTVIGTRLMRRPEINLKVDHWLLTATGPFGKLARDAQLALYTRALAGLLMGGVPLEGALATAATCLTNQAVAAAAARIRGGIRNGQSLSRATGAEPLFPARLVRLLALAEQTANLPQALLDLAKLLERERGVALDRALSLLTPVLTLILGIVVGTIFSALIAGLMSLNDIAL